MLNQIAINSNEMLYDNLPQNTFAQKLKKAKILKGFTQEKLSQLTGLSRSTINELEAGYRNNIKRDTLKRLQTVLGDMILDDYLTYILHQEDNIKILINTYGINKLSQMLNIHRSTLERWRDGKYQIPRDKFKDILSLVKPG